eukprot:CAMPEP_0119367840 /NCGR_PEP_ID=MMETSP1334-20130426/14572_1 /TAXON_ID=127549 /ORGANISM="Calcidiscus leptoporus, Strain RCC1130" /LENGTH=343 /DNA_ID=CAMNT_0007384337 /DNA_START=113 /DNA_END=1141 /DNA_ORIENTATION=+
MATSARKQKRARTPSVPLSVYTGRCARCALARSCEACVATLRCAACTESARCGSCRVKLSVLRAGGVQLSCRGAGGRGSLQLPMLEAGGCLDLPRSRAGLNELYRLIATTTRDIWLASGGRWMYSPASEQLHVEVLFAKDQYETPAHIWRYAVEQFKLDHDANASSLNAVLPSYGTRDTPRHPEGARIWLNPAYGDRCTSIGATLEKYVWKQGCAVVALLPALTHSTWWHTFVMRAESVHFLTEKVHFLNPLLDAVPSDYMFPLVLVVWEPAPPIGIAVFKSLALPRAGVSDPGQLLRVRRCCVCSKFRVLPRHQAEPPGERFTCGDLADPRFASCASRVQVW